MLKFRTENLGIIAFGMGLILLITKLAGLIKLQVLTSIYGVKSNELDIFNAANIIPEFIFTIIVIGGVNAALIPVLSQTSQNESQERLTRVFSSIINIFLLSLIFICLLVFIFTPEVVNFITNTKILSVKDDFSVEEHEKLISLLRILIFSPIILCVSSIFSSILQVKKSFWVTTLAPLFYNLGIIGSAIFLSYHNKDLTILAYGVLLGSVMHFLVQVPTIITSGIKYTPLIDFRDKYVIQAIRNTFPRIISLTSDYIANIFQVLVALNLQEGSLTSFRLAISIRDLATSMFGLSVAQAYFPKMTELANKKNFLELQQTFSEAIRTILFWTIPITVLFIVLRTPIVQLLFGIFNKEIGFSETNMISYSLLFLSFGVIFYSVLGVVIRVFFSLNDSITPTIVSIVSIFIELAITFGFVNLFSNFDDSLSVDPIYVLSNFQNYFVNGSSQAAIGGVAFASSLAIFINLAFMVFALNKKGIKLFYEAKFLIKKLISGLFALILGLILFRSPIANWFNLFDTEKVIGVFFTTLNMSLIICLIYYIAEKIQKDPDILFFENIFRKFLSNIAKIKKVFKTNKIFGIGSGS